MILIKEVWKIKFTNASLTAQCTSRISGQYLCIHVFSPALLLARSALLVNEFSAVTSIITQLFLLYFLLVYIGHQKVGDWCLCLWWKGTNIHQPEPKANVYAFSARVAPLVGLSLQKYLNFQLRCKLRALGVVQKALRSQYQLLCDRGHLTVDYCHDWEVCWWGV